MPYPPRPIAPRLRARSELRQGPLPDACQVWLGPLDIHGYGRLCVNGKTIGAHRAAYELWIGKVPQGLQLDHLCRDRACINPRHLEPVSVGENIRRGHLARGVLGGRGNRERKRAAHLRYRLRKRLGIPGPLPGETRAEYHLRIETFSELGEI